MGQRQRGPLSKSEQMARVKSKNTSSELCLRRELWAAGARYRLHADLPGTPDLVFTKVKLAIFVDGCFWHGCPQHYTEPARNAEFWRAKLHRNLARDRRADASLAELGWQVLRVWEHEVSQNTAGVVSRVLSLVAGPREP